MAHLINNSFSTYELTNQEELEGSILSITQKQVIQNQIAMFAERKIAIRYDPSDPVVFAQEEAECKGAIDALKWLVAISTTAEEAMTYDEQQQDMRDYNTVSDINSTQRVNDIFKQEPVVKPSLNINPKT